MSEAKTLEDLSITELKAGVYDRLASIEQYQNEIGHLNARLKVLSEELSQTPAPKGK